MENKEGKKKKEKKSLKNARSLISIPSKLAISYHIEFGLFYYACMIFTHKGGMFIRLRAARNSS